MTWNPDHIADRRLRTARDRHIEVHDVMRSLIATREFSDMVALVAGARPPSGTGRPRRHSAASVTFLYFLSMLFPSLAKVESYLSFGNNWESYRRRLHTSFPDDPLLGKGSPAPTKSLLRHWKQVFDREFGEKVADLMFVHGVLAAAEMGIGVNTGTMLNPGIEAGMFGDAVVIRPMSRYTAGDMGYNQRLDRWQQRRYDKDATYYTDGTGTRAYGNQFVHLSARTGAANEVVTFGIHPLFKTESIRESDLVLRLVSDLKNALPEMAMVHYDKALRGRSVDQIWSMQLLPMIGVYDKSGKTTAQVPLGKKTINGLKVDLFAHRGGINIKALDGTFIPLSATKLSFIPNADGSYRVYCDYVVPSGTNCDTRLWGGNVQQRMNSPKKADFVYGEHIRAHAPGSPEWRNLYGQRSMAESVNSWMKSELLVHNRARSLNQTHQWIDLMFGLMMRNHRSLMLYRRRTQLARTASPPAA